MTRVQKQHLSFLVIAGLVILLVGGGLVFYGNLTSLSKSAVERLASRDLGIKVEIDSLDIDPENESVVIRGLTIANPKGYKRESALTMAVIDISSRALQREQLAFEDIKVSDVKISVEAKDGATNISDIRNVIYTRIAKHKPAKADLLRVVVDHIVFTGVQIEPAAVTEAIAKDLSPHMLPEIHLRGIGDVEKGILLPEAAARILTYVINVALRAAADKGYLDSLTPEQQTQIGARLSFREELVEDTRAFINRAPSDAKALEKKVKESFKVNE